MIIIVYGLPGSGKTYFAKKLAARINADYVGTDELRKEMFSQPKYTLEEKTKVYHAMAEELYEHSHAKKHLIMDGTFYLKDIRDKFVLMAERLALDLIWIEIFADPDLTKSRLAERRKNSDADYDIHLQIKEKYEPMYGEKLRLESTNENIETMLEKSEYFLTTVLHRPESSTK